MHTRFSIGHKGFSFSYTLWGLVKVLSVLSIVGWGFFFWVFPSHAASLFDDNFEDDFVGEWTDWDTPTCSRGVVLSTDYAHDGVWSLSADRSGSGASGCTDQIRSVLGHNDSRIVQVSWWMFVTESNITSSALTFYGDTDGEVIGGVNLAAQDFRLSGGTIIVNDTVADNTWYRVDWKVDFSTGCHTAKINSGAWATPECGITETYLSRVRFKAAGSVDVISYIDQILLVTSTTPGESVLPSEFESFIPETPTDIGDLIADYPSHDDVFGSCDFWTDGLTCLWTWVEYAIVPVENSMTGLLSVPLTTLITRWPWAYISVPWNSFSRGITTGDCPFQENILAGEFWDTDLPDINLCTFVDDADLSGLMDDHPVVETIVVSQIYLLLGFVLYQKARSFFGGNV